MFYEWIKKGTIYSFYVFNAEVARSSGFMTFFTSSLLFLTTVQQSVQLHLQLPLKKISVPRDVLIIYSDAKQSDKNTEGEKDTVWKITWGSEGGDRKWEVTERLRWLQRRQLVIIQNVPLLNLKAGAVFKLPAVSLLRRSGRPPLIAAASPRNVHRQLKVGEDSVKAPCGEKTHSGYRRRINHRLYSWAPPSGRSQTLWNLSWTFMLH